MQEDYYEIQASLSLQEIPMDIPAYVITFLKDKTMTKNIQVYKFLLRENINKQLTS